MKLAFLEHGGTASNYYISCLLFQTSSLQAYYPVCQVNEWLVHTLCIWNSIYFKCDTSRFDSFMLPLYVYLSCFFIYLILLVSFFFYFNFFCSLNLTCSIVSSQRCVFFSDISSYLLDESDLTVFPIVHVCFVFFDCPGSLYHNHPA